MIARFNFANALATNRIKGTSIDVSKLLSGSDLGDRNTVSAQLIRLAVLSDASPVTLAALDKAARSGAAYNPPPVALPPANVSVGFNGNGTPSPPAAPPASYISELITLLIGSPEFQQR